MPILNCRISVGGLSIPCRGVVDTGCTGLVITKGLADQLAVSSLPKIGASTINHGGGWHNVHHFHTDIVVGPFQTTGNDYVVKDLITWVGVVHGGDALIGMEFLTNFDVTFSRSGMTIDLVREF